MTINYQIARKKMLSSSLDNECIHFFEKNGYKLEAAYCYLFENNLKKAKKYFASLRDNDIRAKWGEFIVNLIEGRIYEYPTYFELRNFLEIDINLLISYYKGDYVEKIAGYADFLSTINPEVHKFIGRVFWNNDLKPQAMFFLDRAKSYFYHDPELHYLLASIYYQEDNIKKAEQAANDCLRILPDYYPAISLLQKIKSN